MRRQQRRVRAIPQTVLHTTHTRGIKWKAQRWQEPDMFQATSQEREREMGSHNLLTSNWDTPRLTCRYTLALTDNGVAVTPTRHKKFELFNKTLEVLLNIFILGCMPRIYANWFLDCLLLLVYNIFSIVGLLLQTLIISDAMFVKKRQIPLPDTLFTLLTCVQTDQFLNFICLLFPK